MTKALILAAGSGTRLHPKTLNKPKALINLFGESLLARQKKVLLLAGIKDITVVVGHKAKSIIDQNYNYIVNKNYQSTNMVSSFFCAIDLLCDDEDVIVSYGDIVYQLNNLKKLLKSPNDISVMVDMAWKDYWKLRFEDPLSDAESLLLEDDNTIKEIGKKTSNYKKIHGQYTGLIKIKSGVIKRMFEFYSRLDKKKKYDENSFEQMYFTTFLQLLISSSWKIHAVLVKNGWLEIDSLSDLNLYKKLKEEGNLDQYCKLDDY